MPDGMTGEQADTMIALLQTLVDAAKEPRFPPVARPVAPVADATENRTEEPKARVRTVDAAKAPRDYIYQYLDEHPDEDALAGTPELNYRDLAQKISQHFGMDFVHTTVYRAVKARRNQ